MGILVTFVYLIFINFAFSYTQGFIASYDTEKYIFFGSNYSALIGRYGQIDYGIFAENLCSGYRCYGKPEGASVELSLFKGGDTKFLRAYRGYRIYTDLGYEVLVSGKRGDLEKTFIVYEGISVSNIKVSVYNIDRLYLEKGNLVLEIGERRITFSKPIAYQYIKGSKVYVDVEFYIYDKDTYGFKVGEYDRNKKLYIDPITSYAILGGTGGESAMRVFRSSYNDDIYIIGYTASPDFPLREGYVDRNINNISWDILVVRLSKDLKRVKGISIIGGTNEEWARAGAIDEEGNIYVCGWTVSPDFPIKGKQFGAYSPKSSKAFVIKLSPDLKTLVRSFRLGGSDYEFAYDMFIDEEGYVYIAGETTSVDFPVTKDAYDVVFNGGSIDIFVMKFDNELENIIASTYVGGKDGDAPLSIYVDNEYVYIAGLTWSYDFPVTEKAFDKTFGGNIDGIVIKLTKDLSELVASTYIGGILADNTGSIAVDKYGNVYVGGKTFSWDMPFKRGGYKTVISDFKYQDAYVIWLPPDFSRVKSFTYLGGYGDDAISNIVISERGTLIIGGSTTSYNFPVTKDERIIKDKVKSSQYDIYLLEISPDLRVVYSSILIGGSKNDSLRYFFKDGSKFILAGSTYSEDLIPNVEVVGLYDLFVFEYDPDRNIFSHNPLIILLTIAFWSVSALLIYRYFR